MNHQFLVRALVCRRRAVLSDPERTRRRKLRIRFELGKVFDEWGLLDHIILPSDPTNTAVRFLPNPRTDWIDYTTRSSRAFQSFDTGVRSAIVSDSQRLRAFGEQLLRALHPQAALRLRLLHAFAGEWWAEPGGVVFTVEVGLQTVRCSWREGGDES